MMLANWAGEDAGLHADPHQVSKELVDMILNDIREHGFPSLDLGAAHERPRQD
jgi:hypothetical protein